MVHLARPFFHRHHKSDEGASSFKGAGVPNTSFFLDNRLPTDYFKQDILKLIHTLHIARWQAVDPKMADLIEVRRISGALTNAIYAVGAPKHLLATQKKSSSSSSSSAPPKLLLRVYGPQVNHLIDRERELSMLRRLSEQNIGPRILGTFTNGRFEQFLDAITLSKDDIRDPATSIQISKRMRELHDGIQLLPEERQMGPKVWTNLEKWLPRAFEKLSILEKQDTGSTKRILQVDTTDQFVFVLDRYKQWIVEKYGGIEKINDELVFAHNDAQNGNLLRVEPPKGSPLLRPQNEHRQLVVIDFEYSGPNTRAYDIANHFCEWMADYNHPELSYHVWNERYPTRQQQLNLIRSYVEHGVETFEDDTEMKMQLETERIFQQVLEWRPAAHAMWAMWGIVQAVIDVQGDLKEREELDKQSGTYSFTTDNDNSRQDSAKIREESPESELSDEEDEAAFDNLAYASEKAQLFWSDMIQLGIIDRDAYQGELKFISA